MTRRHKSHYYSSEGLRQLQAQINELWEWVEGFSEVVMARTLTPEEIEGMTGITEAIKGCPPPAHDPQPFKVQPTGRGWYQVVDSEGKPIHEGKLRKVEADVTYREALEQA